MYVTDALHFLDTKGAIGPKRGAARKMAEFLGNTIVAATLPNQATSQPKCIKCAEVVEATVGASDEVHWRCTSCSEEGRISNWRHTLWDMTMRGTARHC